MAQDDEEAEASLHRVLLDRDLTGHEIYVLPAQRDQLAHAHAGAKRHENHRAPLLIDRGKQAISFLEVEEVEFLGRRPEPVDLRHRRDQPALARDHQHFAG